MAKRMHPMAKGKIAEKIVVDLFKEAGFEVVRYGYEYNLKQLAQRKPKITGKAADYIRHQPDLIVVNKRGEAFFVEVKFRSKVIMPERDIFPYPSCYVVLLTKGAILAQSTYYLFAKKKNFQLLNQMPPFKNIPYPLIEKYIMRLRRQLGDDTLVTQYMGKLVGKFTDRDLPLKKAPSVKVVRPKKQPRTRKTVTKRKAKGNIRAQRKRYKQRKRSRR